LEAKFLDFKQATVFCLGYRLPKHKMTRCAKSLEGPWSPLATPMPWLISDAVAKCWRFYDLRLVGLLKEYPEPLINCVKCWFSNNEGTRKKKAEVL